MFHWLKYQRLLPDLVDGALPASRRRALRAHARNCEECGEEMRQLSRAGAILRQLPSPPVPADLEFQVRCRISQERALRQQPGWAWKLANTLVPLALPAGVGVLAAVIAFATFLPQLQTPVRAASEDVPMALRTPARLRGPGPIEPETTMEEVVVQLLIDQQGRVADYAIIAGTYTPEDARALRNRLLFTVFDPATVFGRPTPAILFLSFHSVQVRG